MPSGRAPFPEGRDRSGLPARGPSKTPSSVRSFRSAGTGRGGASSASQNACQRSGDRVKRAWSATRRQPAPERPPPPQDDREQQQGELVGAQLKPGLVGQEQVARPLPHVGLGGRRPLGQEPSGPVQDQLGVRRDGLAFKATAWSP